MRDYIRINPIDNVAVALTTLEKGTAITIDGREIVLSDRIQRGHKFALYPISRDGVVVKYGSVIGSALCDIAPGCHVHTHNIKTNLNDKLEYSYSPATFASLPLRTASFMGFHRPDGRAGVRNELWIIPTVGCVNSVARRIAQDCAHLAAGSIDTVTAFTHPYGCSQMDDDQESTRRILADLIHHPNAGGVLVLGLGCENSNIGILKGYIGEYDPQRVKFLECQTVEDELSEALKLMAELARYAGSFHRKEIPASQLVIGVKCGGSDGLSGITANPTVGVFMDKLISCGASGVLTEVPEMFGAETLLMDRCIDRECFDKMVKLINDFKDYFASNGQTIYENPSPGNKAGGISTLEDKSLGCVQKSGSTPVMDVLEYAQVVKSKGLNVLSAPGNDLVSSTALAASGAQIVLFTTGRGTPFASPVPTVKISTNTALSEKKQNWIDFDCGGIADDETICDCSERLFSYVLEVASGTKVCAETAGYHDMAIFKRGVTL